MKAPPARAFLFAAAMQMVAPLSLSQKLPATEPEKAKAYMQGLKETMKKESDALAADYGIPGTEIGFWDQAFAQPKIRSFAAACVKQLASGKDCRNSFKLLSGKAVSFVVNYEHGANMTITSVDGQSQRRMSIKPGEKPVLLPASAP